MTLPGIYIRLHGWRGFSLVNVEPDLFSYVFRLGFCTVCVCKVCLLNAYRRLRSAVENAVASDRQESR